MRCRHKAKVVVKFHQREFVSLRISQVIKQFFTSSVRNCNKGEKEVCSPTPWFHFFLWEDHLVFHRRHFLITPLRRRKANGSFNGDDFSVTIKLPVTEKFKTEKSFKFLKSWSEPLKSGGSCHQLSLNLCQNIFCRRHDEKRAELARNPFQRFQASNRGRRDSAAEAQPGPHPARGRDQREGSQT